MVPNAICITVMFSKYLSNDSISYGSYKRTYTHSWHDDIAHDMYDDTETHSVLLALCEGPPVDSPDLRAYFM